MSRNPDTNVVYIGDSIYLDHYTRSLFLNNGERDDEDITGCETGGLLRKSEIFLGELSSGEIQNLISNLQSYVNP